MNKENSKEISNISKEFQNTEWWFREWTTIISCFNETKKNFAPLEMSIGKESEFWNYFKKWIIRYFTVTRVVERVEKYQRGDKELKENIPVRLTEILDFFKKKVSQHLNKNDYDFGIEDLKVGLCYPILAPSFICGSEDPQGSFLEKDNEVFIRVEVGEERNRLLNHKLTHNIEKEVLEYSVPRKQCYWNEAFESFIKNYSQARINFHVFIKDDDYLGFTTYKYHGIFTFEKFKVSDNWQGIMEMFENYSSLDSIPESIEGSAKKSNPMIILKRIKGEKVTENDVESHDKEVASNVKTVIEDEFSRHNKGRVIKSQKELNRIFKEQQRTGMCGEDLVYKFLESKGLEPKLTRSYNIIEKYDIWLSNLNKKTYIEVKTTTLSEKEPFYISERERHFALKKIDSGEDYKIYRVFGLKGTKEANCFILYPEDVKKILLYNIKGNSYLEPYNYKINMKEFVSEKTIIFPISAH